MFIGNKLSKMSSVLVLGMVSLTLSGCYLSLGTSKRKQAESSAVNVPVVIANPSVVAPAPVPVPAQSTASELKPVQR